MAVIGKEAKVYVIIVTFNGINYYSRLFDSLRDSITPISIVVVDNNSQDETIDYLKSNYPWVTLLPQNMNLGFGGANNIGVEYALSQGADFVFLLNQDTFILPNTFEILLDVYSRNTDCGILSPMHLTSSLDGIESGFLSYIDNSFITDGKFFEDMYYGRVKECYHTSFVNAAAWLLPRDVLMKVGGFDPMFLQYGEDNNYVHRVLFHRYKVGICTKAAICHDTENRNNEKSGVITKHLSVLTRLLDINQDVNLNKEVAVILNKALRALLTLNIASCKIHIEDAIFIIKERRRIEYSRKENKKVQCSWL